MALLLVIIIIISGVIYIKNKYPNSILNSYTPQGPTYKTDDKPISFPAKQLDQGADAARTSNIELTIQPGITKYYTKYNMAPNSLDDLVSEKFIKSVPKDPLTGELPLYSKDNQERGCKAWYTLSNGTEVAAYCF